MAAPHRVSDLLVSSESFEDLRNSIIGRLFYIKELYPVQEFANNIYMQSSVLTKVCQNDQKDWMYFSIKNVRIEERLVKETDILLAIDIINHKNFTNKIYPIHDVVVLYDNKFWVTRLDLLVFVK